MRLKTSVWARVAGFAAATLLTAPVLADDGPRYTYGEIGYSRVDFDDLNEDGDFFDADLSLAVHDMIHLFAGYSTGSVDVANFDVDVTNVAAGVGLNVPLSNTIDFVFDVAYLWIEFDAGNGGNNSIDEDGYGLSAGVRAMLTPRFEMNGGVSYASYSDSDSDDDTALNVGMVYNFTDMFALTAGAAIGDNVTSYGAGLRLYLGNR